MTADLEHEKDLRALLRTVEQHAPTPPRLTERLLDGLHRPASPTVSSDRAGRTGWVMPALAAAAVLVIAIAGAIIALTAGSGTPRPGTTRPPSLPPTTVHSSTTTPAPSPRTSAPTVQAGVVVGPWHAATVGGLAARDLPLTGTADSLYVAVEHDDGPGVGILRVDPATGAVLARSALTASLFPSPVLVDGTLWIPPATARAGIAIVHGLDPKTLAATTTIRLHTTTGAQVSGFTASSVDHRLFIGLDDTISVLDTRTGAVTARYRTSEPALADLAVSPDGDTLYASYTITSAHSQYSYLAVLDPASGQPVGTPIRLDGGTGVGGLTSSRGGVWVTTGSGMTEIIQFHPADDLSHTVYTVHAAFGGGGWPPTATATDRVVFEGGDVNLVCADPTTGAVRASARLNRIGHDIGDIASITVAGGRLFAHYIQASSERTRLVRLTPPATCTP